MDDTKKCSHPPSRYYSWFAYDGVLCIGCCDCGDILKGAIEEEVENEEAKNG